MKGSPQRQAPRPRPRHEAPWPLQQEPGKSLWVVVRGILKAQEGLEPCALPGGEAPRLGPPGSVKPLLAVPTAPQSLSSVPAVRSVPSTLRLWDSLHYSFPHSFASPPFLVSLPSSCLPYMGLASAPHRSVSISVPHSCLVASTEAPVCPSYPLLAAPQVHPRG